MLIEMIKPKIKEIEEIEEKILNVLPVAQAELNTAFLAMIVRKLTDGSYE
jgi:hypothetical protein